MVLFLLSFACTSQVAPEVAPEPAPVAQPQPGGPPPGGPGGPPPPPGGKPGGSGAALQDPSGFPVFHDWPAPPGSAVPGGGAWSAPVRLTDDPAGGYRPQIAVSPKDDTLHAVYYVRADEGDIIQHQRSTDAGQQWTDPAPLGHDRQRNWGPDIVARPDGSVVVVYDHAMPDMRSRGYLTTWDGQGWSEPEPLTPDDGGEVGSGHVANAQGGDLAYILIGKALGPEHHFQARARWRLSGTWTPLEPLTDGVADAWHTNVERRPDGTVLAGFDIGTGGAETTLYLVEGRDGSWSPLENLSASGPRGERPHFAFDPRGTDHVAWFHKVGGKPVHIYVRSGRPGAWGTAQEPARGYGGFHFDPDIAINKDGVLCLVWGWDSGRDAEMVYALNRGDGWSAPKKLADIDWGKPGLPSLDTDAQGNFHVIWNQGVRGSNHVYYARLSP